MAERTARSRLRWGVALLDFAFAGTALTTVGVAGGLLQGEGVGALRSIPYALACFGSLVFAAHRSGARVPEYLRGRLRAPL